MSGGIGFSVGCCDKFPEAPLIGRCDSCLSGKGRGLGDLCEVAPLDPERAVCNQILKLRFDLLGKARAVGAREIRVEHHDDGSVNASLRASIAGVTVLLGVNDAESLLIGDRGGEGTLRGGRDRRLW